MTTSTINSSVPSASAQSVKSVSTAPQDKGGEQEGFQVAQREHSPPGVGGLMHNVLDSLQSLGLNIPPPGHSGGRPNDTDSGASSPSTSEVRHALHAFMYDLHQALTHAKTQQQSSSVSPAGGDGETDSSESSGSTASGSSSVRNGYSNYLGNLQNLISTFSNGSATGAVDNADTTVDNADTTGAADTPDTADTAITTDTTDTAITTDTTGTTGASSGSGSTLEFHFNNLVQILGGSFSSSPQPNLLDFLNRLAGNDSAGELPETAAGSIIEATA